MAELKGQAADRFFKQPDSAYRIVLIHGPDRGRVDIRAKTLIELWGESIQDPMAVVDLDSNLLETEPSRLSEEADSIGMFGDQKIVVARMTDPKVLVKSVEALLDQPPEAANVLIVAGDLKKSHPLRTRIEKASTGVAIACYAAEDRDIAGMLMQTAKQYGLAVDPDVTQAVVGLLGADHALTHAEIEKLCLYAKGEERISLEHVQAILVDASSHAMSDVTDAAFSGDRERALLSLERVLADGIEPSVLTTMLLRHGQMLERMRIDVEKGSGPDRVVASARPPIFFKRRRVVETALRRWNLANLRRANAILDQDVVDTRLDSRLKRTRLERQVLRVASLAARRDAQR